jgi:hypothetical protein
MTAALIGFVFAGLVASTAYDAMCSAWFEHHPELQPWHNGWQFCRYDSSTGMCIDEFGDEQRCGDAVINEKDEQK